MRDRIRNILYEAQESHRDSNDFLSIMQKNPHEMSDDEWEDWEVSMDDHFTADIIAYHITDKDAWQNKISKQGLVPNKGPRTGSNDEGIYLHPTYKDAINGIDWISKEFKMIETKTLVLLGVLLHDIEFKLSYDYEGGKDLDGAYELIVFEPIPINRIHFVKEFEI